MGRRSPSLEPGLSLRAIALLPSQREFIGKFAARWSPDGKFLAHGVKEAAPGTFSRIRIRSVESGQARELRPQMRYINDIFWSVDSRSFAAAGADLKGRHGIYRLDAQTGEVEAMILSEEATSGVSEDVATGRNITMQPRFAPGGKKLFYRKNFRKQGDVAVSEARLVERDLVSGTERILVDLKRQTPQKLGFVPSPDGRMIAYHSRDDANDTSSLNLLPLDGGEPRELLRMSAPQALELFDWTPDGRNLIVRKVLSTSGDGELLLLPVAGGDPRRIGIDNPRARAVSIHPDGKRITYLVQGTIKGEVVVMENLLTALEKGR